MPDLPWSLLSPFSQTFGRFVNNPVTDWDRFYSPQVIFNYNPQDQPIESHVLSKVGSYGSQLSTIIDVIEIVLDRAELGALSDAEAKSLKDFTDLRTKAGEAVDEARGLATPSSIADAVFALAKRHPERLAELRQKLGTVLDEPEAAPKP